MSEFEIDFEWPRAPRYELRLATAEEASWLQTDSPWRGVPEAEWPLHYAQIVAGGGAQKQPPKTQGRELAGKGPRGREEGPAHILAPPSMRGASATAPPPRGL